MIGTITSKGQITVPVEARRKLGLQPGCRVDFIINEREHLEMIPIVDSIQKLKGMLPKPPRRLSLEEMDQVIAEGAQA